MLNNSNLPAFLHKCDTVNLLKFNLHWTQFEQIKIASKKDNTSKKVKKTSPGLFMLFTLLKKGSSPFKSDPQESISVQLQLASLCLENEKLIQENQKLQKTCQLKHVLAKKYIILLRDSRCLVTKLRKKLNESKNEVSQQNKPVLKQPFA